jgi:hypothetical protein
MNPPSGVIPIAICEAELPWTVCPKVLVAGRINVWKTIWFGRRRKVNRVPVVAWIRLCKQINGERLIANHFPEQGVKELFRARLERESWVI